MRVLMVNKFLHPAGGAETYMFQLGAYMEQQGHDVQYFGMEHPDRNVSNRLGKYTSTLDFHSGRLLEQATYPLKIIYSAEAKKKLRAVLEDFRPDVLHINNFNFQLTPSILVAAEEYRTVHHLQMPIILTAHDYQLVCPNHMMYQPARKIICEQCLDGHFHHCITGRCVHGSSIRSVLGALESHYWHHRGIYQKFDAIVCPSAFIKAKLDTNPVLAKKTTVLRNFIAENNPVSFKPKDYILYFGRFSQEKGVLELLEVCKSLPKIPLILAGSGPLEDVVNRILKDIPHIKNVGFQRGVALKKLIGEARFTIYPSVWYENCPFSVIESITTGTPVLGSDIGGIPELLQNNQAGQLFPAGDLSAMRQSIEAMWENTPLLEQYRRGCRQSHFDTLPEYCEKLLSIYQNTCSKKDRINGTD